MIIWINGAFGSGKTQAAYELWRRLPGSYVYDPENAGYFIRKNLPKSLYADDFQDYPMWRSFNRDMLEHTAANFTGDIIVPMTVANRAYLDEITGALSEKHAIKHFILYAERDTLLKRLASRLEGKNSWAARQIDRCIIAFQKDITEVKIHTDHMSISQVAETIGELSGVSLLEDRRSGLKRRLDRLAVQRRHIRQHRNATSEG